ncbi:MAG: pilus assembly protein [Xanthomonadales bacterium]|nr:pilus assembly protein [Ahrensia sp.]MBL38301.1 pilus assembly protein [Xanthomonadales bacterium]
MHEPKAGFTLIELMLALAVAAVLMSLALPSMRDLQQRQRIVSAANELVAHINLARQHAVLKREITVMCPSLDGAACTGGNRWEHGWIVFRDPDRDGAPDRPGDVLRVGGAMAHLLIDSAGRTRIRYRPSGAASGTNLTIKLCDTGFPDQSRAVIVSNPGRPRVGEVPDHLSCPRADA